MVNISFNWGGEMSENLCCKLIISYRINQMKAHFFVEKFVFLSFSLLFFELFCYFVV